MIKFFLKKGFYDGWDNFLVVLIANAVYSLFISAFIFLYIKFEFSQTAFALLIVAFSFVVSLYSLGVSGLAFSFTNYDEDRCWKNFAGVIAGKFLHFVLYFILVAFIVFNVTMVIPYYMTAGSGYGVLISVVLFWILLLILLSLQYFYPMALLNSSDKPLMTLKKALALVVGNKGFTLFVALRTLFDFVISIPTAFLIPGFAGSSVSHMAATKILIIRYDYIRENNIKDVKTIDVADMLSEEDKLIGKRTLKTTFFPWKKDYAGKRKTKQDT